MENNNSGFGDDFSFVDDLNLESEFNPEEISFNEEGGQELSSLEQYQDVSFEDLVEDMNVSGMGNDSIDFSEQDSDFYDFGNPNYLSESDSDSLNYPERNVNIARQELEREEARQEEIRREVARLKVIRQNAVQQEAIKRQIARRAVARAKVIRQNAVQQEMIKKQIARREVARAKFERQEKRKARSMLLKQKNEESKEKLKEKIKKDKKEEELIKGKGGSFIKKLGSKDIYEDGMKEGKSLVKKSTSDFKAKLVKPRIHFFDIPYDALNETFEFLNFKDGIYTIHNLAKTGRFLYSFVYSNISVIGKELPNLAKTGKDSNESIVGKELSSSKKISKSSNEGVIEKKLPSKNELQFILPLDIDFDNFKSNKESAYVSGYDEDEYLKGFSGLNGFGNLKVLINNIGDCNSVNITKIKKIHKLFGSDKVYGYKNIEILPYLGSKKSAKIFEDIEYFDNSFRSSSNSVSKFNKEKKGFKKLKKLKKLKKIILKGVTALEYIDSKDLLRGLKELHCLTLTKTNLTYHILENLSDSLKQLTLEDTVYNLSKYNFKNLSKVEKLSFKEIGLIDDNFFMNLKEVKELSLDNVSLKHQGEGFKYLKNLEKLKLYSSFTTFSMDESSFDLYRRINNINFKYLKGLNKLKKIHFSKLSTNRVLPDFLTNLSLDNLNLRRIKIDHLEYKYNENGSCRVRNYQNIVFNSSKIRESLKNVDKKLYSSSFFGRGGFIKQDFLERMNKKTRETWLPF